MLPARASIARASIARPAPAEGPLRSPHYCQRQPQVTGPREAAPTARQSRIKERNNRDRPERRLWTVVDHMGAARGPADSDHPTAHPALVKAVEQHRPAHQRRAGRTSPLPAIRQPTGGTGAAVGRGSAPAATGSADEAAGPGPGPGPAP